MHRINQSINQKTCQIFLSSIAIPVKSMKKEAKKEKFQELNVKLKFENSDHISSVQLLSLSDSLRPHELQYTRPPYPSPNPRVHPNPCPLRRWCHPTISSSVIPFSSCPQIFPRIRVFSSESALCISWQKYWSISFNISRSSEHPGLIFFRMDWLDLPAV